MPLPAPVTFVQATDQQHMLFLFLPLKRGTIHSVTQHIHQLTALSKEASADTPPDLRAATGVHFFFSYGLPDGGTPVNCLGHKMFVPSFKTFPGKDALVVMSIYDADFAPYINSFVTNPIIAYLLNGIVDSMDETDIPGVDATGPTSAHFISTHEGVAANPDAFNCLLMRYNFGDPTIAAGANSATAKYHLGANFPGMTVRSILQNFNGVNASYPWPPVPVAFGKSVIPTCGS